VHIAVQAPGDGEEDDCVVDKRCDQDGGDVRLCFDRDTITRERDVPASDTKGKYCRASGGAKPQESEDTDEDGIPVKDGPCTQGEQERVCRDSYGDEDCVDPLAEETPFQWVAFEQRAPENEAERRNSGKKYA